MAPCLFHPFKRFFSFSFSEMSIFPSCARPRPYNHFTPTPVGKIPHRALRLRSYRSHDIISVWLLWLHSNHSTHHLSCHCRHCVCLRRRWCCGCSAWQSINKLQASQRHIHHGGYHDPRTIEVAADDRASSIVLFACRNNVHLCHFSLFARLPETDQQAGLLRVLGEHPL